MRAAMLLPIIGVPGVPGQRAAGARGQLVQRDVPHLLAVDQGAVHVEEHRGRSL